MAWRDHLRQASFRGVPFQMARREVSGGRRGTLHEYPLQDEPFWQDLGLKAHAVNVQGYLLASLLGGDYIAARDRLEAALDREGPGEFVDQWGRKSPPLVCRDWTLVETEDEGGTCTFTMQFVKPGAAAAPAVTADRRAAMLSAADGAEQATVTGFASSFSLERQPAYVRNGAVTLMDRVSGLLGTDPSHAISRAASALAPEFARELQAFGGSTGTLLNSANTLGFRVANLMSGRGALFGGGLGAVARVALGAVLCESAFSAARLNGVRALFSSLTGSEAATAARSYRAIAADVDAWSPVPLTTASRQQEIENREALGNLVRRTALVNEARATAQSDFLAYDDAIAARDSLADRLDAEADRAAAAGDDESWRSLTALRAAASGELSARSADLSRLMPLTLNATTPGLVLAHRLYGDLGREDEIVERNRLRRPGFIPGGQPLQVLSPAPQGTGR